MAGLAPGSPHQNNSALLCTLLHLNQCWATALSSLLATHYDIINLSPFPRGIMIIPVSLAKNMSEKLQV